MTVQHILIVNLHSAKNLGDDGIMLGTLAGLSRVYPDARITLAANDPQSWRKYETLTVTGSLCTWVADCRLGQWRTGAWRMPLYLVLLAIFALLFRLFRSQPGLRDREKQQLLAAYYDADLIFSCGGGNFYAHHSPSPGFFWALMALAFPLALGKTVVMLPQSVGPVTGRFQRTLAGFILRHIPLILVRERLSARFLQDNLGVNKEIYLLPDLAFGMEGWQTAEKSIPKSAIHVGVSIMDRGLQISGFSNQAQYELALVEVLEHLHRKFEAELHIFVQCYGPSPDQDDRPAAQRIVEALNRKQIKAQLRDYFQDAAQIQAAYAKMDLIIATRMHTGIFALSRNIPLVMIAYQPKSQGVMAAFGLEEYCLEISIVRPDTLQLITERALKNREQLSGQISTHLLTIQKELAEWERLLAKEKWRV